MRPSRARVLASALLILFVALLAMGLTEQPRSQDQVVARDEGAIPPSPAGPTGETPALAVQTLEFLPGQGRSAKSFLLYQFEGEPEPYLDLWDAVQILQANRYFDPVTRKVAIGFGGHRVKLTDGSAWVFLDGEGRRLAAPCRVAGGRLYLPLSFWSLLLGHWNDLPLRQDSEALRLIGGLRSVNVHRVEWIFTGDRLRGIFQLSEPLTPRLEPRGDAALAIHFPGGRLADFDWEKLPPQAPVDSLSLERDGEEAVITLYFRMPLGELRSAEDPLTLTWAFNASLPSEPGLPEPEFERELAERIPGGAAGRRLTRIIMDPGHGGEETGCVAGAQVEKDWNLQAARWLEPFLEDEGFEVLWTRKDDATRRPHERVQAANVADGDLFLSLHFTRRDAGGEGGMEIVLQESGAAPAARGSLRPWSAVQAEYEESSLELAASLQRALRVLSDWPQLGIRREDTAILEGLDMPALLLELGNLDDPAERLDWEDDKTRQGRLQVLARALAFRAERWQEEGRR